MRDYRVLPGLAGLCLLGGCLGNVLGGGQPDALYRFGASQPASPADAGAARQTVVLASLNFAPEVDGNRVLAVHGASARYIRGMRWVSAAPGLFGEALAGSFATRAPQLRFTLSQNGDVSGYALALRVTRFEADYGDAAMASAPMVAIEGEATLLRLSDRHTLATRHFATQAPAAMNGAGALAAAFDRAAGLATAQITDWVATSVLDNPG